MALTPFVLGPSLFDDPITRAVDRSLGNFLGRGGFDLYPFTRSTAEGGPVGQGMIPWSSVGGTHPMDVIERDDKFEVYADAPGFSPEDVKVELNQGVLTISAHKEESKEEKDDKGQVWRKERVERRFTRSFTLPQTAAPENISANLENGVLTVTVPKLPEAPKPQPKRIAVGGGSGTTQQACAATGKAGKTATPAAADTKKA